VPKSGRADFGAANPGIHAVFYNQFRQWLWIPGSGLATGTGMTDIKVLACPKFGRPAAPTPSSSGPRLLTASRRRTAFGGLHDAAAPADRGQLED
jgi:hypothetical protein